MTRDSELERLEQLYEAHHREVIGLAFNLLRDRAAAEDVAQDVFLSAWRARATYAAERGSARTWLLSMVRHRCIDHLRQQAREAYQRSALMSFATPPYDSSAQAIESADNSAILAFLHEVLSAEQMHIVELAYFGGLSHAEIAKHLEVPIGTVKSRIRTALSRLRPLCLRSPTGRLIVAQCPRK